MIWIIKVKHCKITGYGFTLKKKYKVFIPKRIVAMNKYTIKDEKGNSYENF